MLSFGAQSKLNREIWRLNLGSRDACGAVVLVSITGYSDGIASRAFYQFYKLLHPEFLSNFLAANQLKYAIEPHVQSQLWAL